MKVTVKAHYLEQQSLPTENKFVFAYTIGIENTGSEPTQLISRYWHITDGNNGVQEVQGLGVVGKQPRLMPGESYTYTSGAVLDTPTGTMHGYYVMQRDDGTTFKADVPAFALVPPQALH